MNTPGARVVSARAYLTDSSFAEDHSFKVFNLCKSYSYQSLGYYVSLLAEARGHEPLPRANTIEDLQSATVVRLLTEDLNGLITHSLAPIKSRVFELSIYFGRNVAVRYDALSQQLFNLLQAPLMRAQFEHVNSRWRLSSVRPLATKDIPPRHHDFVVQAAMDYFSGRRGRSRRRLIPRYDLAILHDPADPEPPSNQRALQKFEKAAKALGIRPKLITRSDFSKLGEFDALFIRDTTFLNHYTYRFARRAAAEGLVVIDDPHSILKCNNKVYLAELLERHNIPAPKTLVVHRDNVQQVVPALALPCVLKQPDSSFSLGVTKVASEQELLSKANALLEKSELIVAQEYLATDFDWRVGILDRRVLFVAKYYFPSGHWQVVKRDRNQRKLREGRTVAVSVAEAPQDMIGLALKTANLIGDGFYGVDIKQIGNRFYIMEINDNPNVDSGNEDGVLKDALYREIMGSFMRRIEASKWGAYR